MEAWPVDVPQDASVSGYGESPSRNVASFAPDVGPPIDRRRSSVATSEISCSFIFDDDQTNSLMAFYRDTIKDGTLPFTRTHPRTGDGAVMKFKDAPKISALGGGWFNVSMSFYVLP